MKNGLNKSFSTFVALLMTGVVYAHPGAHGSEGLLSGIAHLVGEHGYLLLLLLGVAALATRRRGRA